MMDRETDVLRIRCDANIQGLSSFPSQAPCCLERGSSVDDEGTGVSVLVVTPESLVSAAADLEGIGSACMRRMLAAFHDQFTRSHCSNSRAARHTHHFAPRSNPAVLLPVVMLWLNK